MNQPSQLERFYLNKRVVIAGGSEGIGLSVGARFIQLGADVWVGSRNTEKLKSAQIELEKCRHHPSQRIITETIDVANFENTQERMTSVVRIFGTPDIVVNSAGYSVSGYLENAELAALREMMEVNFWGTLHVVRALLPSMRAAGRGHIVNIASMAGYLGLFGYTGYCASKYAVIGFSWALRHEVRPYGIHVSVLCPPNTRTPGFARENLTKPKEILAMEERVGSASADRVAHALMRELPRRPFIINPTWDSRLVYAAARLAPTWLADRLLKRPMTDL